MGKKELFERRKHKRFQVQEGAFAVLNAYVSVLGVITDICRGGLAFRYVAIDDRSRGLCELDILLANYEFHLGLVPFKAISDLEIARESPFGPMKTRRCGAQFGELTINQMSHLEYFIQTHTIRELRVKHSVEVLREPQTHDEVLTESQASFL